MKSTFLFLLLFMTGISFAQQKEEKLFPSVYDLLKKKTETGKTTFPFSSLPGELRTSTKASKIVQLPLDHMPCLLPDVRGFNMPVAGNSNFSHMPVFGFIPLQ